MEEQILNQIADLLKTNIQSNLKKNYPSRTYSGQAKPVSGRYPTPIANKIASGNLYNSINVEWVSDFNDGLPKLVVDFGSADYWEYVENGRRPGRYPPLGPIDRWTVRRVKPARDEKGRFIARKSLVYLIRRSIGKYGIFGIKFLENAINTTIDEIQEKIGEAAKIYFENYIKENLDFN